MSYWPVSSQWATALAAKPFTPYQYVDIYENIGSSTPVNTAPLLATSGTVSWDTAASVRRTMSAVQFAVDAKAASGLPLVPNSAGDLLFPDGTEAVVYKGFRYADGSTEVVPQGRFLIESTKTVDGGAGGQYDLYVQIDGSDRMASLARNEFSQAYTTVPSSTSTTTLAASGAITVTPATPMTLAAPCIVTVDAESMSVSYVDPANGALTVTAGGRGANGTTAASHAVGAPITTTADVTLATLIQSRLPGVPMNITPSTYTLTPASYSIGDDPSTFIGTQALSAGAPGSSLGMEVYFDRTGTIVLVPIVDPTTLAPVVSYVEGPGTIMLELQRTLGNKGIPNWIIVVSQGSNVATPLRADWQDLNPASPTYLYGSYPTTVQTYTTSLATTQQQVQGMANALGQAALGKFDGLIVSTLGDPAFGDGDVALVTRSASRLSAAPYVFQQGTLSLSPLTASTLTGFRALSASAT